MEFAHPPGEGTLTQAVRSELHDSQSNRPWRWMFALDCIIAPAALLYTVFVDLPRYPGYMHLLVTYHFGFVRRALVGTVLSWFTDAIPFWYVYAIAIAAWIVTLVLFVAAFRKVFGFKPENFPLFVFVIGSPFFFKNFAIALGHFDIYGCLWALVALLIPAGALYPLVIAGGCVGLGADPSSAFFALHPDHRLYRVCSLRSVAGVFGRQGGLRHRPYFIGLRRFSGRRVLWARAGPAGNISGLCAVARSSIRSIHQMRGCGIRRSEQEITLHLGASGRHALRFPVYALLIALHFPIGRYLKALIVKLPTKLMRRSSRRRIGRDHGPPTFRSALSRTIMRAGSQAGPSVCFWPCTPFACCPRRLRENATAARARQQDKSCARTGSSQPYRGWASQFPFERRLGRAANCKTIASGKPFVGPAGRVLDQAISSMKCATSVGRTNGPTITKSNAAKSALISSAAWSSHRALGSARRRFRSGRVAGRVTPACVNAVPICCIRLMRSTAAAGGSTRRQAV